MRQDTSVRRGGVIKAEERASDSHQGRSLRGMLEKGGELALAGRWRVVDGELREAAHNQCLRHWLKKTWPDSHLKGPVWNRLWRAEEEGWEASQKRFRRSRER